MKIDTVISKLEKEIEAIEQRKDALIKDGPTISDTRGTITNVDAYADLMIAQINNEKKINELKSNK